MSAPERCNCGSEDCPRCYPLNRKQAEVTESHRELAIEQAVETLMDHGQYPAKGRKQLDLYDILTEERDASYMAELYLSAMSMHTYLFKERVEKERKAVTQLLWLWLKDTDLINELAQDIANEDE
jgi:hypothetical protein